MEQLLIQVNSKNNADAIKEFVSQFSDATIEAQTVNENTYYFATHGITKSAFETE